MPYYCGPTPLQHGQQAKACFFHVMGVVYMLLPYGDGDFLGTGIPIGCRLYGALQQRVGHVLEVFDHLHGSEGSGFIHQGPY
jgi:hypothetical protein